MRDFGTKEQDQLINEKVGNRKSESLMKVWSRKIRII
jgi:hypothetical protein